MVKMYVMENFLWGQCQPTWVLNRMYRWNGNKR